MSARDQAHVSRRTFVRDATLAGAGTLLLRQSTARAFSAKNALPQRMLGRTGQRVSTLALGTWPCGRSSDVDVPGVGRLVREALDLGINFVDTAHNYGKAEEGIGKALGKRRDQVFLTTKVWADTADEARKSLEGSLRALRTDHVDLAYVHSVGSRNVKKVLSDDGSLAYLLRQKEKGTIRFIGISGHSRVDSFLPLIKTGHIDVVMMAMNFVDRNTYGFERKVLPVAREREMGIACMKVFGGMTGGFGTADGPNPGPMVQTKRLQQAIRYALELPGVATLVIGPHTVEQLRQNVQWVREAEPLSGDERSELLALGKQLAPKWGPHFGPAV